MKSNFNIFTMEHLMRYAVRPWYNFETNEADWHSFYWEPTTDDEALLHIPNDVQNIFVIHRAEGMDIIEAMGKALDNLIGDA